MPTVEQLNSLFSARTQTRQPSVHSRQFGPTSLSCAPADETGNFCSERLDRSVAAAALTVNAEAPPTESERRCLRLDGSMTAPRCYRQFIPTSSMSLSHDLEMFSRHDQMQYTARFAFWASNASMSLRAQRGMGNCRSAARSRSANVGACSPQPSWRNESSGLARHDRYLCKAPPRRLPTQTAPSPATREGKSPVTTLPSPPP